MRRCIQGPSHLTWGILTFTLKTALDSLQGCVRSAWFPMPRPFGNRRLGTPEKTKAKTDLEPVSTSSDGPAHGPAGAYPPLFVNDVGPWVTSMRPTSVSRRTRVSHILT